MNAAALDAALRRFPRVLAECAILPKPRRYVWLIRSGCVPAIIDEYRAVLKELGA